jgi:hypothetical protein
MQYSKIYFLTQEEISSVRARTQAKRDEDYMPFHVAMEYILPWLADVDWAYDGSVDAVRYETRY